MTLKKKKPRAIVVLGRRWRDQCNTYHTAEIVIDGKHAVSTPMTYGYDRQFEETAADWLEESGYIFREKNQRGESVESIRVACDRLGVAYYATACDVRRMRDL